MMDHRRRSRTLYKKVKQPELSRIMKDLQTLSLRMHFDERKDLSAR